MSNDMADGRGIENAGIRTESINTESANTESINREGIHKQDKAGSPKGDGVETSARPGGVGLRAFGRSLGASVRGAVGGVFTQRGAGGWARSLNLAWTPGWTPGWNPGALSSVRAILPGLAGDGLVASHSRAPQERAWGEHADQMRDALEAWRTNPLARRLVALVTSTCVGDGIRLSSPYAPLDAFLRTFWTDGAQSGSLQDLALELPEWSDELSRSGELFLALFTDAFTGSCHVRALPAAQIDDVIWQEGDYRTELAYRDTSAGIGNVRWWKSPLHEDARLPAGAAEPVLLHYAVNRPVGALRGESDLAPILPWLRRYTRWLEDRVRLNASVRSFLWVVNAPMRIRTQLAEQYRQPPEPGTVIIADELEKWSAVTPNLHAADAEKDGRAIRWMIAAGGPGTALIDLGEGEDANLATGTVMQEQKRRFLRRRQRVLIHVLVDVSLHAFRRHAEVTGAPVRAVTADDVIALAPDISPEDNADLAHAAAEMVQALTGIGAITGTSDAYRRMALRLFARFAGETVGATEFEEIVQEGSKV